MVLRGKIYKEQSLWVVAVSDLEITTQGRTKQEAYAMIKEAIELHVDRKGFKVRVEPISREEFIISANETALLMGLMLKRQRQINGLSISEVTRRLKKKTNTYYHQYEQGKATAGIDKLSQFLHAMNPDLRVEIGLVHSK